MGSRDGFAQLALMWGSSAFGLFWQDASLHCDFVGYTKLVHHQQKVIITNKLKPNKGTNRALLLFLGKFGCLVQCIQTSLLKYQVWSIVYKNLHLM